MHISSSHTVTLCLLALAGTAAAFAGTPNRSSSPIIITRPAIPDGSIASRAPFPSARPFDDVKGPDGHAIDNTMPPNTPATNPEPLPAPPPKFAIFLPAVGTEPGTSLTGRAAAGVSAPLDPARILPTIQATDINGRDQMLNDLEVRIREAQVSLAVMRRSVDEMSASGRDQFHAANAEVNEREAPLRQSISDARNSDGTNWANERAQLAADYAAFASALGRIDAAAGITPPPL